MATLIDGKAQTFDATPIGVHRDRTPALARGALATPLALALLRILSCYSWFNGAFVGADAKFAPSFLSGVGLVQRINAPAKGFVHSTLTPDVAHFLTATVVPHAVLFAWLIALGEAGVGFSLLLGLFARLDGLFAIAQAVTYALVAGGNGADTIGHNYMLALAGLVVLLSAAGRTLGIDGLLVRRFPNAGLLRVLG